MTPTPLPEPREDTKTAAIIDLAIQMPSKKEASRLLAQYHIPARIAVRALTTRNRRERHA